MMMRAVPFAGIIGRADRVVTEFLTWWTASLMALLPIAWRQRLGALRKDYILDATAESLTLRRRKGATDETLRTLPRHPASAGDFLPAQIKSAILRLSSDLVYIRSITLPLAAENTLPAILRNEIDRVTPFSAAKTYFDFLVTSRDREKKTLGVTLVVAKREVIDDLTSMANTVGITISRVLVASQNDPLLSQVDFLRYAQRPKHSAWGYANAALVVIAIGLVGLVLSSTYDRLDREVQALAREVAQKRAQAAEAAEIKKKLADLTGRHAFLDQRKLGPAPLGVIHDVTKALSDETWIAQLQFADRDIRLSGFSKDAATVLTDLQKATSVRNPRFLSPLTQTGEWERFDLTVERVEGGKP